MGNRPTGGGRNEYNPKAGKTDIDLVDPAATRSSMAAEMVRDVPLLLFSMDILSAGQCAVRNGSAFIPDEAVAGDMGIRNHIFPRNRYDLGFTIENIVYLELSRRGGKVNIGKYGSTEVDFVTQKEGVLTYYQVTADMTAEETFEREMRPLRSIQDNYEKIVLTLDRFSLGNYDGIKVMNVIDWLLE